MRRLLIIPVLLFAGCAEPDELSIITDGIKEHLFADMHDPSSFSLAHVEILDTVRYRDAANSTLTFLEGEILKNKRLGESEYSVALIQMDEARGLRIKNFMSENEDMLNEVSYYTVAFSYRAKNLMGALGLHKDIYDVRVADGRAEILWGIEEDVFSLLKDGAFEGLDLAPALLEGTGYNRTLLEMGLRRFDLLHRSSLPPILP